MRLKFLAVLAGALFMTVPAFASTIDFCSGQPTGVDLGTNTLTSGGIIATGYKSNGVTNDLFCKNEGPGEVGLGLAGTSQDEIGKGNFIQLDVSNLVSTVITIESVQSTEGFDILGTNSSGTLVGGIVLANQTGGGTDTVTVNFGSACGGSACQFLDLTATAGNVLLGSVSTPEPSTYLLMGTGLLMLGFIVRRKFASASC